MQPLKTHFGHFWIFATIEVNSTILQEKEVSNCTSSHGWKCLYIVGTIPFDLSNPRWLEENINFGDSSPKVLRGTLIWQFDPCQYVAQQKSEVLSEYFDTESKLQNPIWKQDVMVNQNKISYRPYRNTFDKN